MYVLLIILEYGLFNILLRDLWCSGMRYIIDIYYYFNCVWLLFRIKRVMGGGILFRIVFRERFGIINVLEEKVCGIMFVSFFCCLVFKIYDL